MNKEIYVINLDFSNMRFLTDNSSVNTTIISNYVIISIGNGQLREVLPEIQKEFQDIISKYTKKYQFKNEKE